MLHLVSDSNRIIPMRKPSVPVSTALLFLFAGIACTPKVELAAPEKPITINLNVKIEHEVRVSVERELDDVLAEDSGLF